MGVKDTMIRAMRKALRHRRRAETPLQTAARLRVKHGVVLSEQAKTPLPKSVFDELWGDHSEAIAHAQALARKYTADKPETSVDAFLTNRRADSGE
jgi:antitoxin VapB